MNISYCGTAWSPKQHGRGRNSYLGDVIPLTAIWENDLMWVQEDFISKTTRKLYLLERELKYTIWEFLWFSLCFLGHILPRTANLVAYPIEEEESVRSS